MGFDAVPQLLDAIDNDRFCRSIEYVQPFFFSHHVLRVGDCAAIVLEHIAGVSFGAGANHHHGKVAAVKKKATAWWQEFQKKGEKQMLIEAVESGDPSYEQLSRLVRKYPQAAFEPVANGLKASILESRRSMLVITLGELDGKKSLPLLKEELKNGPFLMPRLDAARLLLVDGHEEAAPALLEEWHRFAPALGDVKGNHGGIWYDGLTELVTLLAQTGRKEAIEAIAKRWTTFGVGRRLEVLSAIANVEKDVRDKNLPVEVQNSIGEFLLSALVDRQEHFGVTTWMDNRMQVDPRNCDYAALYLAWRCNQPELFDFGGTLKERNRQLYDVMNAWLSLRGRPLVPTPEFRGFKPLASDKVQPLIKAMFSENNAKARPEKVAAIERLGLPALAEVHKALTFNDKSHPAYKDLEALAARLACVVEEVTLVEGSARPTKGLEARVKGLVGKTLTSAALHDLLTTSYDKGAAPFGGMRLVVYRDEMGDGLRLEMMLIEPMKLPAGKRHVVQWPFLFRGGEDVPKAMRGRDETFPIGQAYPEFSPGDQMHLRAALTASQETSIRIHLGWYLAPGGVGKD